MRTVSADRTVTGTILSTGTPGTIVGATVIKPSTGVYTIRIPGFRAIRAAHSTLWAAGGFTATSVTQPDTIQVNTWNSGAAATDITFSLTVTGVPA